MGALLGYVVDIVVGAVMPMEEIDNVMKARVIRALNKVVWIQNDLMSRHYVGGVGMGAETITPPGEEDVKVAGGVVEGKGEGRVAARCPFSG